MVVGDGSALRRSGGPDVADPRALEADDRLRTAVQTGDPRPLAELRAVDAEQLMITGAPVRRWLAGQLTGVHPQAELGYADDPFGVFMIIASWRW